MFSSQTKIDTRICSYDAKCLDEENQNTALLNQGCQVGGIGNSVTITPATFFDCPSQNFPCDL